MSAAVFNVTQDVDFTSAANLLYKGEKKIDECRESLEVHFDSVSATSNSLMVALMMSWHRHAQLSDKQVSFHHLPRELRKIVEIAGLSDTLPLA